MTLARIRAILRRRCQELIADNWTDADLDELINEAYVWVQLQFAQANPDGLIHIDYTTIEVGRSFYPWPRGFISSKEMGYLDTSNAQFGYRDLGPPRDFWLNRLVPSTQELSWSNLGRHFAIFPLPPATIPNAIQKIWMGTLGMESDNQVPEIPFNHLSIVARAQMMIYGETGEDQKDLRDELADYMGGIAAIPQSNTLGNDSLVITGMAGTMHSCGPR